MADQNESGAGASPGSTTAGAQATPGAEKRSADANAGSNDYEAKVRNDPEFAWREVQKHQGRADRAEQKADKFKGLEPYVEGGLTGAQIAGSLQTFQGVLADPTLGEVVRKYAATGKVEMPKRGNGHASAVDDDDETLLTPEEREIRDLKREVMELKSHFGEHSTSIGQQAFVGHFEKAVEELNLDGDDRESAKNALATVIRGWGSQGDVGRSALRKLGTPEGLATVRTLLLNHVYETKGVQGLASIGQGRAARDQQTRRGLATDRPARGLSANGETLPEASSLLEALQQVEARPELLDQFGY